MASIGEVAREAGVSITTVSHVFSGKRPVAPETRRRVLDVAARLGYRPHRAARGLATGRAMTIGLHFPFGVDSFALDPYFPELLEGMSAAAVEAGYGFVMIPASPGTRFPLKLALKQRRFDGVIMANPAKDSSLIPMLLRRQIPLVTIGRYLGADQVPWVDNDLRGAMAQLMAHLAEQAYRRPALISLQSTFSCDQDVEESFEKEVRVRGGEVRIVRADDLSEEQGFLLTLRLLSQPVPPDAVVASTDRLAIGVLRAASELSVRVPRDLGVIGMDDSVLARHSHPPLTSVRVGPHSLGQAAIESLLTIVEHSEVPDNRVLPAELVPRASTRRNRRRSTRA